MLEASPIQGQQETATVFLRHHQRDVTRPGASMEADAGVASSAAAEGTEQKKKMTTQHLVVRTLARHWRLYRLSKAMLRMEASPHPKPRSS